MMYGFGEYSMLGGFGMIVFWAAFIWLIVWLIIKNNNQENHTNTPLQIAKERFARGEISKKQYEDMKQELVS
ncbi:MAG: SHOCT domain-containing protein [archaeon]